MKIFILLLTCILGISCQAQEKVKDTIYFSIDKYYTISPTITANMGDETYSEWLKATEEYMKRTKTNGNIFFIGDGYLIKKLKPKKILSIKEYIENRKFYFDGKYNQMVDDNKLQDSLTNKYVIYFVNGDQFIRPRQLSYTSYYPRRDKDGNFVDHKVKDTLFFSYDSQYIINHKETPNHFYIQDGSGVHVGDFYFTASQKIKNYKTKSKEINLKEFIRSSKFYNENKRLKLRDYDLSDYLKNYVIFLVKTEDGEKSYLQVDPSFEIE